MTTTFRDCDLVFYVRHFHDHGVPSELGLLLPRHPLWRERLRATLWSLVKGTPGEREAFDRAFDEAFHEVMHPYRVPVAEWVRFLRGQGLGPQAVRERLAAEGYPADAREREQLDALLPPPS